MSTPSAPPIVVLISTIEYGAALPGFCGRCFSLKDEPRSRMTLYADVRPAALVRRRDERTQTSALLCQHYARKQQAGLFTIVTKMLMCPTCLTNELVFMGLGPDVLERLQAAEEAEAPPEESRTEADETEEADTAAPAGPPERYALFMHSTGGVEGRAVATLAWLPRDMELSTALSEEMKVTLPPRQVFIEEEPS